MANVEYTEEIRRRFWAKVHKTDGCWVWTASTTIPGYGQMGVGNRRVRAAHRISYEMAFGPIPKGMCVCHTCDNTRCVRPDHLFLGTRRDNILDAVRKGRHSMGSNHPDAKLTARKVARMRTIYRETNLRVAAIASMYDVSSGTAWAAIMGKTWKHVPGAVPKGFKPFEVWKK